MKMKPLRINLGKYFNCGHIPSKKVEANFGKKQVFYFSITSNLRANLPPGGMETAEISTAQLSLTAYFSHHSFSVLLPEACLKKSAIADKMARFIGNDTFLVGCA